MSRAEDASAALDASALLALLQDETGAAVVEESIEVGAAICSVNLSEVVAKLSQAGMPEEAIHEALDALGLLVVDFDVEAAYAAGLLRPLTIKAGLSLGDRACLALARRLGVPALTADRAWSALQISVAVRQIR